MSEKGKRSREDSDSDHDGSEQRPRKLIKPQTYNDSGTRAVCDPAGISSNSSTSQEKDVSKGRTGNEDPKSNGDGSMEPANERIEVQNSNESDRAICDTAGTSSNSPTSQEKDVSKGGTGNENPKSNGDGSMEPANERIEVQNSNESDSRGICDPAGTSSNSSIVSSQEMEVPNCPGTSVGTSSTAPSTQSTAEESEKCPVCLGILNTQEVATLESCNHRFCVICLSRWSERTNTCPVDRKVFTQIQVRCRLSGKAIRAILVEDPRQPQVPVEVLPFQCRLCGGFGGQFDMTRCGGCDLIYHVDCLYFNFYCRDCVMANFLFHGHP